MHRSMSRAENGGKNRLLLGAGGTAGPEPTVRFADAPNAFDPQTTYSWTLAVGRRRPRRRPAAGDLLRQRLRQRPPAAQPLDARAPALRRAGGAADLHHAELEGARPRLVQGHGRRLRRPQRRRHPRHVRQQHRRRYALEESHFVWVSTGDAQGDAARASPPTATASEDLGLSRSGWGWDARFADFDNDGVLEAMQAIGFVRGEKNRWPELQELAMGNDDTARPRRLAPLQAGRRPHRPAAQPVLRAREGRPLLRPRGRVWASATAT